MSTKLKPNFKKLEKIRKLIIFPFMVIGTIIPAGFMLGLKFFYPEELVEIKGFTIPTSWMGIIAIIYLLLGIAAAIFVNSRLRNQNHKLSQEFLEISSDKIYLSKYDGQKSFSIKDALNYENLLDSNKNIIGITINFKDGQRIELRHYDRKELKEILNKINITKNN